MSRIPPRVPPTIVIALLAYLSACGPAAAAQLPATVLAPLRAQVTRTSAALAAARDVLARAARDQRQAAASEQRSRDAVALANMVDAAAPGFASMARAARAAHRTAAHSASSAQDALDRSTTRAARLQGDALDAQRRFDAIQRAASTSNAVSPSQEDASYRFGNPDAEPVSARSLDTYLQSKASPITGSGAALLAAGVKWHVDPRLIVAIAGAESYFGVQLCGPFNAWGYGCPSGPVRFGSWADAVNTVAQGLREHYLDSGLTTVGEIHLRYAPPNAANDPTGLNYGWADNVARFLIEQGGDPEQLEGPLPPTR